MATQGATPRIHLEGVDEEQIRQALRRALRAEADRYLRTRVLAPAPQGPPACRCRHRPPGWWRRLYRRLTLRRA